MQECNVRFGYYNFNLPYNYNSYSSYEVKVITLIPKLRNAAVALVFKAFQIQPKWGS